VFYQQHKKGSVLKVDEDLEAEMYITTQKLLTKNGYEQYEISNYSKPGFHCRHNLSYWKRHDYIGLGAGAHSFLGSDESTAHGYGARWSNLPGPSHYIESVNKLGHARNRIEEVSKDQAELEFFSLGLRTAEGIDLDDYQNQFGDNRLQEHKQTISKLAAEDLVMIKAQHAKLTQKGFLFADTVFSSFL
jgi:oxygen-independent coproporphyrinogen-3 oxidase